MDPVAELASPATGALAAREAARLGGFLAGLDDAGWQHLVPACPGWTMRDAAVHLSNLAGAWTACIRRALAGEPGPPWDDMDAVRREGYERRRALDNARLLADFREHTRAMDHLWSEITLAHYPVLAWHRNGPRAVGRYQVTWLWEVGMHRYDVESAFDPRTEIAPDVAAVFVEYLFRGLPRYLAPELDPTLRATYRFELSAPERYLTVRITTGGFEISPGTGGDADVVFSAAGGTWVLAVANRIDRTAAVEDGRIRVDGHPALAERFWKVVKPV